MNFKSDTSSAISQEILNAVIAINNSYQESYGQDQYSSDLKKRLSDVFETNLDYFLVSTRTAANCLSIASLIKPYEAIACHYNAHLYHDECGAANFFTNGSGLLLIDGNNGKLDVMSLKHQLERSKSMRPHHQKAGCISITQASECGTVYSLDELHHIDSVATHYHLPIHMDGASFANALVKLKCTPAEMTWKNGIKILSLGASKNGCSNIEGVIIFDKKIAADFDYRVKQTGHLISKTKILSIQLLTYLKNDLWLKNAAHANNMAQELLQMFKDYGFFSKYQVDANKLFINLEVELAEFLYNNNCRFCSWDDGVDNFYRFVTSHSTTLLEIDNLARLIVEYKRLRYN